MPVGTSNRVVSDVGDVTLKRKLYSALAEDGRSLKEWFETAAVEYLHVKTNGRQLEFGAPAMAAEKPEGYGHMQAPPSAHPLRPRSKRSRHD